MTANDAKEVAKMAFRTTELFIKVQNNIDMSAAEGRFAWIVTASGIDAHNLMRTLQEDGYNVEMTGSIYDPEVNLLITW